MAGQLFSKLFRVLMITALITMISCPAFAGEKDTIHKTFKVSKGGKLFLDSDRGSVEIMSGAGNTVDVTVYKESRSWDDDELDDFEVRFKQSGDNVDIIGEYRGGSHFWKNSHLRIRYVITVPDQYDIQVKTSGGSIEVADIEGDVQLKTSGGSIKLGNIIGPVDANTSGGSIRVEDCKGNADLHTSGGSINIGDVDGEVIAKTSGGSISIKSAKGSVSARTSGGSINVDEVSGAIDASTSGGTVRATITKQFDNDCRLSTSGGSVIVSLARDIRANIDASTSGGRVKTDFEVTVRGELKKNKLVAKINGGGPELFLRTSGGNVEIREL